MKVQTETREQEQQTGIDSRLSPQQKLELLEERLLHGEIDQDVYLNLKAKYEMEAKPYQPLPQLPPAAPPEQPVAEVIEQPSSIPVTPTPTVVTPPTTVESVTELPQSTEPPLPTDLPSDVYQQPPPEQIPQSQPPHPLQVPQPQAQTQPAQQPQVQQTTIEPQEPTQIQTKRNQINSQNSD
jgi:hypothetical protein